MAAVTILVFWQVGRHEFIILDDTAYITRNINVGSGLTPDNIKWAFQTGHASNWHPLTWISHMADVQLFGLRAGWHHRVGLLLHVLNSTLLLFVLWLMTGRLWPSWTVAALFALHPLHVESVAWAAERKDLLSTLFWLTTMGAWWFYSRKPSLRRYAAVGAGLALGLMSKPMLVTLPLVLLLLDYWPLGRRGDDVPFLPSRREGLLSYGAVRLALEKTPLLLLSVASSIVTLLAQGGGGAVGTIEWFPLGVRLQNALFSYGAYVAKTFVPLGLSPFYPHPGPTIPAWKLAASAALLTLITLAALRWLKRLPYLAVGWFWFLGTLLPVIGLVQVGAQGMADRYTYVPLIGLFVALCWLVADLAGNLGLDRRVLPVLTVVLLLAMVPVTWRQVSRWRDSRTLFSHAVAVDERNWFAHLALGTAYALENRLEESEAHLRRGVALKASSAEGHFNLAVTLAMRGNSEEAEAHYRRAVAIDHGHADARNNLAALLAGRGDLAEAESLVREALRLKPDGVDAHVNLGSILCQTGRPREGLSHFEEALRLDPHNAAARRNRELALGMLGGASARGE